MSTQADETQSTDAHIPVPTPAQAMPTSEKGVRLFFLDNIRVLLTILVILHHLALTYSGVIPAWYYLEPTTDTLSITLLLTFISFNQAFFMGLFFLLSGYFIPGSFERKGARAFLKDRFLRLGVPLLIFMLVVNPSLTFLSLYPSTDPAIAEIVRTTPFWLLYLLTVGTGPLWFVAALLFFTCVYVLWRKVSKHQLSRRPTDEQKPITYGVVLLLILLITSFTFLIRIGAPIGTFIPVLGIQPPHFAQYIILFIVGIIARRQRWLETIPSSMGKIGAAIVPVAVIGAMIIPTLSNTNGATWYAFANVLMETLVCIGMSLSLLVLFRKRFNNQGTWAKFLSTHAYTVYIIHAVVTVLLAYAMSSIHLYPLLKFGLASLIAVPLCFFCGYLVRRIPFANKIL